MRQLKAKAFADNTIRSYNSHRKAYLKFCCIIQRRPVPATSDLLCKYVAFLTRKLRFNSIRQYLCVISHMHKELGYPDPIVGNYHLTLTLKGARRVLGSAVQRREPITPHHLLGLLKALDLRDAAHAAIWAAALLMFYGLFRRSSILACAGVQFQPHLHLCRKDIVFTQEGLKLVVKWSKTDQFRERRRIVPFPRMKGHALCPTQAVYHAFKLTPKAPVSGPAFVVDNGPSFTPLRPEKFSNMLLSGLSKAGFDTSSLGSHSLRRGGATLLWNDTDVGEAKIKALGDWASSISTLYTISDTKALAATTSAMAAAVSASVSQ